MTKRIQPDRFQSIERTFFRVVLATTVLTALLAFGAYVAASLVVAVPAAIVSFTGMLIYYHAGTFLFAFFRILKYLVAILPRHRGVSILRSVVVLVVSPVLAYATYITFFIMALTGCAA